MTKLDRGGGRGARHLGPKFSQVHAVFWKIWQNRKLVPPWRVGAPFYGESCFKMILQQELEAHWIPSKALPGIISPLLIVKKFVVYNMETS